MALSILLNKIEIPFENFAVNSGLNYGRFSKKMDYEMRVRFC